MLLDVADELRDAFLGFLNARREADAE